MLHTLVDHGKMLWGKVKSRKLWRAGRKKVPTSPGFQEKVPTCPWFRVILDPSVLSYPSSEKYRRVHGSEKYRRLRWQTGKYRRLQDCTTKSTDVPLVTSRFGPGKYRRLPDSAKKPVDPRPVGTFYPQKVPTPPGPATTSSLPSSSSR